MAKTSTERMREKKEREAKTHLGSGELTYPFLTKTFSKLYDETGGFSNFEMYLELAGIEPPRFEDERGPAEFTVNREAIGVDLYGVENIYPDAEGAIGRADTIIGCLLDAAVELAEIVNNYKRREIEARLVALENLDTADRATAMNEAVKLNKILDQLNKQIRKSFPEWRVTGI